MRIAPFAAFAVSALTAGTASAQLPPLPPPIEVDFTLALGSFGPTVAPTTNARVNYARFPLGTFQAGTSVRVGTCGMVGAAFTANTYLRLFITGTDTEVAANDESCAGHGSQINYVAPYDMSLELHAGCAGESVGCAGTVALSTRLDATPRPAAVKAAFSRVVDQGVLGKSPDINTLIRGIDYQNAGWGEKYHHQGIARTYNRSRYDLAWSTSANQDAFPQYNNVFFTKLNTRPTVSLRERFGSWGEGSAVDSVIYGSNAGVYDAYDPGDDGDWDGVPVGRRFDHGGGMQSIGNYVAVTSEFVSLPCTPFLFGCPAHGDDNLPPSGQASQVLLYDISQPSPQPKLLISRRGKSSGWVAVAKLGQAQAPPVLRNGYLMMVPNGDQLDLYAVQADPCTGYASLSQVKANLATEAMGAAGPSLDPLAPPTCPGVRTPSQQSQADKRQIWHVGCVKRVEQYWNPESDPGCPNLVSMYEDGERHDFPVQDDVQSATFVTQANGRLFLLAFEGQQVEYGPNSEVQLWRVVFGAASGAAPSLRAMPDGSECATFLCLVRAGTESAHDSYKNMHVDGINGSMFRFGGSGYVVPSANPAGETFFVYGTEHYLQESPRSALFNEF